VFEIIKIVQGKPTLIGPDLRVGIFAGPYYYYLFTPILWLTQYNTDFVLYFNAILFAGSLGYVYWKTRRLVPIAIIGLSNFYLLSARHPGNGYSYLPFLLVLIAIMYGDQYFGKIKMIFLGLLSGVILNFHPLTIVPIVISGIMNWKKLTHKLLFWIASGLTFLPLLLFELKHNFVIIKGLLISKNYTGFINSATYPIYYWYPIFLLIVYLLSKYLVLYKQKLFLSIWLTIVILSIPYYLYESSTKRMVSTENLVQKVISSKIVSGDTLFNLISITDEKHLVPMGHEYRFAFRKYGLRPLDENNYAEAQELLVFVETDKVDVSSLQTWETEQFGQKYMVKSDKVIIDGINIYKYDKKNL
jgi:hypothetical protein